MRIWLIVMIVLGFSTFSIGGVTEASADAAIPVCSPNSDDSGRIELCRPRSEDGSSDEATQPTPQDLVRIYFSEPSGSLEVASIKSSLSDWKRQFARCYERQLNFDPTLEGTIQFDLEVDTLGSVENVSLNDNTVEDDILGQCVFRRAERLRFGRTDGRTSFSVLLEFGFPLPEESPVEGMDYSLDDEDEQSDGDEQSSTQPTSKAAFVSAMSLLLGLIGMSWGFVSMRRRD
jgi:hypothetical protein